MKKYKLIKEYPGSDHEGIVVSLRTPNGLYEGYQYNYSTKHVENNPEYWEEVIEKDYEIVAMTNSEGTIMYFKDGWCTKRNDTVCIHRTPSLGYILRNGINNNIHSVKRLSDGEIFTVGDCVKVYEYSYIKNITEIIINSNPLAKEGIWLRYDSGSSHLSHATKVKKPIFLTHDGKDIFEGDTVWCVNKHTQFIGIDGSFVASSTIHFDSKLIAYFLTQEDAENYIVKNKVLFTTEDGVGIKRGDTFYFLDTDLSIGLSITKSEKCDGRKYFSTFETAQYYMIVNAKVLSIEEFWEFVSKPGSNVVKQKALKGLVKERLNLK